MDKQVVVYQNDYSSAVKRNKSQIHSAENKSQTEKNTCDTIYLKSQGRKANTLIKSRSRLGDRGK